MKLEQIAICTTGGVHSLPIYAHCTTIVEADSPQLTASDRSALTECSLHLRRR